MSLILIIWILLCIVFLGVPSVYYLYMRHVASGPWKLRMDKNYAPLITILIPAHNEEKSIRLKLENLWKVKYPKEKIQVILVNDYSTDKTLEEVYDFLNCHPSSNIEILNTKERGGKSKALNLALKQATGDIIVVSDADCFWSPDILVKALPFLSDQSVGAVTGLEVLLNSPQSWVAQTESTYNSIVHTIRIGESKTDSTIIFQGGFGAYKREVLDEFDPETDDSGTALNIVQKKGKTLLIPEATYFTIFPSTWKAKIHVKMRRATQLMKIWAKCLRLLLGQKLVLSKKISLPETFLYIFNPIIFALLIATTVFVLLENSVVLVSLSFVLLAIFVFHKSRILFVETVQANLILLVSLLASMLNRKFSVWKTSDGSRSLLSRDILASKDLI